MCATCFFALNLVPFARDTGGAGDPYVPAKGSDIGHRRPALSLTHAALLVQRQKNGMGWRSDLRLAL